MQVSQWPAGIDVAGRFFRWKLRGCGKVIKEAVERLAAESGDVECYDVAANAFLKQWAISTPIGPGRPLLDRCARLYARHFRRELIRERQYLSRAARHSLLGT
jgi:hypothetical protein